MKITHIEKIADEQTKLQLKSLLEEIDIRQQSSYQSRASEGKPQFIRFTSDKERKILSFTGKVDKLEVPLTDLNQGKIFQIDIQRNICLSAMM
jgi:hypothetical protein